jgi:hypothetical protein
LYSLSHHGIEVDIFNNLWQVITTFTLIVFGAFITLMLSRVFNVSNKVGIALYCYHLFFGLVYLVYVVNFGGDAIGYYVNSLQTELRAFKVGTIAVEHLTALMTGAGLSLIGVFTIFNIFGAIGLLALYSALHEVTKSSSMKLQKLVLIIVFLPSISFWSAGIGKDAISFMAMGLALYAALDFNRRIVIMALAIAFMLYVRPHMAGMMLIGLVISVIVQKEVPIFARLFVGGLGAAIGAVMIPFALNYAGVSEDASNLGEYIDGRANSNLAGGSSLDIASMPLPLQMFTYLFRPLPFEARSITMLLASIDNMVILYLTYFGFKLRSSVKNINLLGNRAFLWGYCLIAWVLLSMTTANLGIAMRQKWMFAPIFIFLMISIISAAEQIKYNRDEK